MGSVQAPGRGAWSPAASRARRTPAQSARRSAPRTRPCPGCTRGRRRARGWARAGTRPFRARPSAPPASPPRPATRRRGRWSRWGPPAAMETRRSRRRSSWKITAEIEADVEAEVEAEMQADRRGCGGWCRGGAAERQQGRRRARLEVEEHELAVAARRGEAVRVVEADLEVGHRFCPVRPGGRRTQVSRGQVARGPKGT